MIYKKVINEERLVKQLNSGDQQVFADLYDAYSALLFGVIARIVKDDEDAANLMQDCFVKIWRNVDRYDPNKGRLATWIINIARNTAIDFTRSKYYSQKSKNQQFEKIVGWEAVLGSSELPVEVIDLRQIVDRLAPKYRQVIEWMYFDGYSQREIAEIFDMPLGTVKTRSRMALSQLREYFKED